MLFTVLYSTVQYQRSCMWYNLRHVPKGFKQEINLELEESSRRLAVISQENAFDGLQLENSWPAIHLSNRLCFTGQDVFEDGSY